MKPGRSIRFRLLLGEALVLVAFLAGVGVALQRAHADSSRTDRLARLQGTVYLLLAAAEVDADGHLVMPPSLTEPRLALPGSGLYASVAMAGKPEGWRSASAVGLNLPFPSKADVGRWEFGDASGNRRRYLTVAYSVLYEARSQPVPLVLTVLEDASGLEREVAVFERTLWGWLAGAGVFLLLSQTLLLAWGLEPLRRVTREIRRIEDGEQEEITGRYPAEIAALTDNLNTLVRQERERQSRYREALSYLAHSLKTPLAVLRTALGQPATLAASVEEQVQRMDAIVQHQLGRGAASGATRFAPAIALAPVAQRVRESLEKVHAARALSFAIDCPADLRWRMDEGDAFEVFGNLLDNAAKWARSRIAARVWRDGSRLRVRVEDDGPGFSGDPQAMLQMHVRGDETVPGHGVGLAIVRDIVASHHGEITLSRSTLGGAQVDIALPQP